MKIACLFLNGIKNFNIYNLLTLLLIAFFSLSLNAEKKEKPPFPNVNLPEQSRGQSAIERLGDKLPEVAAWYGKSSEEFSTLLRKDDTMWIDKKGRVLFIDKKPHHSHSQSTGPEVSTAPYPYDQTFLLHSKPNSTKVIYLDFNGYFTTGRAWNESYGEPIDALPFDTDGDNTSFSTAEQDVIQQIWQQVAEDFAPFDVDVTTQDPGQSAITRSSYADEEYGTRVVVTADFTVPSCQCGGFAYVGVFDSVNDFGQPSDYYKPAFVFYNRLGSSGKLIAEAATHEAGHNLGLYHDGVLGGSSYYTGHGGDTSVPTSWAPIMGVGYYTSVSQWSKGEYRNADNTEDDIQIIQNNGALLEADDHGSSYLTATTLTGSTTNNLISIDEASGIIETDTDFDYFELTVGNGDLNLDISPASVAPNLDIEVRLYNGAGSLIDTFNPSGELWAQIQNYPVLAGTYYLSVSGAGLGDPYGLPPTGYTEYGSIGQYSINGTMPAPGGLLPPVASASANPETGYRPLTVQFNGDLSSDPDGEDSSLTYFWDFSDDGASSTATNPQHTFENLGSYSVSLLVTDADGLTDTDTVIVTVNNNPPVADATASTYDGPAPLEVEFSSVNSSDVDGTISSYQWQFGDGSSSNQANPTHTYATEGSYEVTLMVTDDNGDTDSASLTINVDPDPSQNTLHLDRFDIVLVSNISQAKGGNGNGKGGGNGGNDGGSSGTQAKVTIVVVDENGQIMKSATVSGVWGGSVSGNVSKRTNRRGQVEFTSPSVTSESGTFIFTVSNITKSGYSYGSDPGSESVSASF
ncbi:PKD domain-containing protein [Vibrio sp. S4M6]|uniref:PKD domain-containing protein n=1 Tax=Vibrio sinus TaxID=2946865 RepID=UPI00202A24BE|nr:PKD domain-containing protein [Vibrio sinus]MCL9783476.1 PKD domain-containing protein [Vibrio sinus]